jgi:hypothetical protein
VNEGNAGYSDVDSDDGNTKHLAFVTHETPLISKHALLLGSQSSANIVVNKLIDGSIRKTEHGIMLNGVEKGSPGINVDLVGDLGDVGVVYYCPEASANILSFAAMSDAGADIRYNAKHGRFTMKPRGSNKIYSFCRQDIPGSDGRFYVCDTRTMIAKKPTVATVAENMQKYSKREVGSAGSARELLARMGYPSVANAI